MMSSSRRERNMEARPNVMFIGGLDVDKRIPLIRLLKDQFEISVLGSNNSLQRKFSKEALDYRVYSLDRLVNPVADIRTIEQITRIIVHLKPKIVHTFDTKPCIWGRLSAWAAGVPVIIGTLPGLGILYSNDNFRLGVVRSIYQPLQRLACHVSDLTIFQNPEDAVQFIKLGVAKEKKTVILPGSGVETQVFDPLRFSGTQRHQMRSSLGLDDTKLVVTMVSRLIRSKGILEFARVAQSIQEQQPETVFLLIGPDDRDSIDALTIAERERVSCSVKWLGVRNDIPDLLAISDIFVLPTFYREGIPRVLLEAASMGLPIIATRVPGCTEVVKHNINGILVPPQDVKALKDAIAKLVIEPSLRHQFGQASRQLAISDFELGLVAERTISIYEQLLTHKGYENRICY